MVTKNGNTIPNCRYEVLNEQAIVSSKSVLESRLAYLSAQRKHLHALVMYLVLFGFLLLVLVSILRRKRAVSQLSPLGKYVLITGCDTGFGHYLSQRLDERGCNVIATCLDERGDGALELKRVGSGRMHVIQLDVTSPESVRNCLEYVDNIVESTGLWALVNNAGINILGDIEFYTMEMYKQVAEVNLYGMVRMTKTFLPLIRRCRGRVVNVTSVKGLITDNHSSAYNMTKYAGEAFSDSLRLEMDRFGIKVVIVEPGNFGGATGMLGNMERHRKNYDVMWQEASDDVRGVYGEEYLHDWYRKQVEYSQATPADVTSVIDAMEDAVLGSNPNYRYLVDGGTGFFDLYCVLARLKPFVPTSIMDTLVRKYL